MSLEAELIALKERHRPSRIAFAPHCGVPMILDGVFRTAREQFGQ